MRSQRKCFWLELAAWAGVLAGAGTYVLLWGRSGRLLAAALLAAAWVLSLFGLNQWERIPKEEREKLDRRYSLLRIERMVWRLPLVLAIGILILLVFD